MFEKILNEEVRSFIKRATDKDKRWKNNILVIDIHHTYYIEYQQERLYWVYDYNTRLITMVYAASCVEAVRCLEKSKGAKKWKQQ